MARKRKQPTHTAPVPPKGPRTGANPERHDSEKIAWQISIFDKDGPWGCTPRFQELWWSKIYPKLQDFESMTWSEIQAASGGRSRGNNSHFVDVQNLAKEARQRLEEIKQDDVDQLFSLRLEGKHRIYGIRDGRVLRILWFDPEHEVYQMKGK